MRRREFLTAILGASATAISGEVWSAPATDQRFLLLFLRGGYDALNIVVPTSSDAYYAARPTIAIARPAPENPSAALALDAEWALHPALRDSIYPLWGKKQIAFVPFAGADDTSRSHFETQDTIELGQSARVARDYRSGFMARLAEQISSSKPIAFTSQLPLTFRSRLAVANFGVSAISKPGIDKRQAALIEEMYASHDLRTAISQGFTARDRAYSAISDEMVAANRGAAPPSGFELAARRVARMMRNEYNLAFLDVGGWDTHVNQGGATGVLADRIGQLGRGLSALADEIGPETWTKTTVVVISEFGRTFKENGDKGTDHGRGSVYWVLGGAINGGRMAGDQIPLSEKTLNQGRDLPVLADYRAIISSIARRLYGLRTDQLAKIFPNGPAPLAGLSLL